MSHRLARLTYGRAIAGVTPDLALSHGEENDRMKSRLSTITGLSLVAALTFGAAGCSNATSGSTAPDARSTSSAPQESAADALTAATQRLYADTATVKLDLVGMTATGAMDPANKKVAMAMSLSTGGQDMKINVVLVDKDVYMKIVGIPSMPAKWLHLDAAKVGSGSPLGMLSQDDPAGARSMVKAMVDVERDGERGFKGTLDLTKSPTTAEETLKALGDKAKAVPFTARVDDQGRLVEFVLDMSAGNASLGKMTTTYADFGKAVTIDRPAASDTIEAPAEIIKAFAG